MDSYNLGIFIYLILKKKSQEGRTLAVTLLVTAEASITSSVSITIEHPTSRFYLQELNLPIMPHMCAKICVQGCSVQLYSKLL